MEPDVTLKPWERFVTGMDTGSDDQDCMVCGIYDALTGKLRLTDVEFSEPQTGQTEPKL